MAGEINPIDRSDLVECYSLVVRRADEKLADLLERRKRDDLSSVQCEALVFAFLEGVYKLQPRIFENASTGGPDFEGTHDLSERIFVEVKHLDADAVSKKSNLKDKPVRSGEGGTLGSVVPLIQTDLKDAASQLADRPGPRICIVGCDHARADMIFRPGTAAELLTDNFTISIPIGPEGDAVGEGKVVTKLERSAFVAPPKGQDTELRSMRKSISAVILMAYDFEKRVASLVGAMHHDPQIPLDSRIFPDIPFARFPEKPLAGGPARIEFVSNQPMKPPTWIPSIDLDRHLRT